MKELTYFYLPYCPYCRQADAWLEELKSENPEYCKITIRTINEWKERKIADQYDYRLVPCFYIGDKKLHEGVANKEKIKAVLDKSMEKE